SNAKTVVNVVKEVLSEKSAVAVAKTLLKAIVAVNPISAIVAQILMVDEKLNEMVPICLAPSGQIDSPWGQAKQIYNTWGSPRKGVVDGSLDVYCVLCGMEGSVHLSGRLKFQSRTFDEANIAMKGNIEAGVGIGIDAKVQARQAFSIPLAEAGSPGFSVSGVFTVGPFVSLKAEADLGISLQGQVIAGANVSIPNFFANLDLVNQEKFVAPGFIR
ncbi:MAG: hypothetical protein Q9180_009097, partial [Flavoplaca navasiana]